MTDTNIGLKLKDQVVVQRTGETGKIIYLYPNHTYGVLTADGAIRCVGANDILSQ